MANGAVLRILLLDMIRVCDCHVILFVTGPAIRRGPLKNSASVTVYAICLNVLSGERKRSGVMIETRLLPIRRVVALRAVLRIALLKVIFCFVVLLFVARPAINRSARKTCGVTFEAVDFNVSARQWKCCLVVNIKSCICPL